MYVIHFYFLIICILKNYKYIKMTFTTKKKKKKKKKNIKKKKKKKKKKKLVINIFNFNL